MPRLKDYSGIENTCPKIDTVISFLESIRNSDDVLLSDVLHICSVMEIIRRDNESLRLYGNQLYAEKEELESEFDFIKKENENLKDDNNHYQKIIRQLEEKISELEDRIFDLKYSTD